MLFLTFLVAIFFSLFIFFNKGLYHELTHATRPSNQLTRSPGLSDDQIVYKKSTITEAFSQ